jgi:hypothetical protein
VALATALYSTLVLLRDTVACLREFQAIKFGPKNTACPPVDWKDMNKDEDQASSVTKIAQNELNGSHMRILGCMKKLTNSINNIGNIWTSDSQIL